MGDKILYGLNGSTTQPLDQETEIRLVAGAGFDLIELRAPKVTSFLQKGSLAELRRLIEQSGLRLLSINSLEQTDTRPVKEAMDECRRLADWAAELGCPYLVSVPGFTEAQPEQSETVAMLAERLAPLAEACGERGVKLGFEFLGFANCTVNRLATAREIVATVASAHLGLVLDTCHFYLGGESAETLNEFKPGELLILHVNDVEDLPQEELQDRHRLLPGLGVAPLKGYWNALGKGGAIDHASLELFRPEYWEREPKAFLAEALAALRRTFEDDSRNK